MYKELYKFTPPGWGKTFFVEDNQAITEGLAAMSMNYFAFFPALLNESTNPNAKNTGFFANPAGPAPSKEDTVARLIQAIAKYAPLKLYGAAREDRE